MTYRIPYPRKRFIRTLLRMLGRFLVPLLARVEIHGLNKFPREGPLIVVGNHTGAMEVVLLTIYSPLLIEYLGSIDIPHEGYIAAFVYSYDFIPIFRGKASREALESGLDVLRQGGVLGLFPEGGIWEPAIRRAQSGVAWLSYRGEAPILPIGFGSTRGALVDMLRLRRPKLTMYVGEPIPPVSMIPGTPRKTVLHQASDRIVDAIWALVPKDEQPEPIPIEDETFTFEVKALNSAGEPQPIPTSYQIEHGAALSKFIHRTTLFNNLLQNLNLPVQPLKELDTSPDVEQLLTATGAILSYLEQDNPYYFTYRYGPKEGRAMGEGVREFHELLHWARAEGFSIQATPVRQFHRTETGEIQSYTTPQETEKW
ncbi:MAG: lysophospholipid acyltransferase family protein [Anaerolineales bacterium]|jgi:1-acyl-sn-glycerol-3-phosphate acyltransferase